VSNLDELLTRFPAPGRVEWIGVRPARRAPLLALERVRADARGLIGDHYSGGSGNRGVTLIQAEHLAAVASMLGLGALDPALLRRNLVVSGINLQALEGARFRIGAACLEGTGRCHPCSRMEEVLGPGGYNAMRGHGGLNARVLEPGELAVGDPVTFLERVPRPGGPLARAARALRGRG
jgi:MOSC domain-containing protein YiiM